MNNKFKFIIMGIGTKQLNSCIDNVIKIDPKYIKAVSQSMNGAVIDFIQKDPTIQFNILIPEKLYFKFSGKKNLFE
jgi:hypothetical protein